MPLDIPETINEDDYNALGDKLKKAFREVEGKPGQYEWSAHIVHDSMIRAKEERDKVKEDRDKYAKQYEQFSKFGDPEKIQDLMQREAMIRDQTKTIEEQIAAANKEAREREAGRVASLQQEKSSLEANLLQFAQSTVLDGLMANSGIKQGYEQEVRATFASQLKTEMQDGRPVTYVMDPKNPSQLARDPDTGDPLTPMKAFQLYKQNKGDLFRGQTENDSGAGFGAGRGSGGGSLDEKDPAEWTWAEKQEFKSRMGADWQSAYQKRLNAWADKKAKARRENR